MRELPPHAREFPVEQVRYSCRQISADEDGALCRLSGGYKIVSLIMIFMTKLFEIVTDYYQPEVRCC